MSERRYRKPNALKHGAFSGVELLPWEDVTEYEKLWQALLEELQPEGPLQEDCVETILSCKWRKRRVRDKRNFDTAAALDRIENRVLWEDPPPFFDTKVEGTMHGLREKRANPPTRPRDDYQQLLGFSASLYGELHESFVKLALSMLPAEFSTHLNEKLSREKFESTHKWVFAMKKDVDTVLLPMVRNRAPQSKAYFETAAAYLTGDRILEDSAVEERLDATIDRALRRLYQLKMARQLHASTQAKLIGGNSPMQLEHKDDVVRKANG